MSSTNKNNYNWRDDRTLIRKTKYKRRYAWFPRKLNTGHWIWFKYYYQKNISWSAVYAKNQFHTDPAVFIDEREYITERLLDND